MLIQNQKGFPNSTFELGQLTEIEGVLTMSPVPMLKINAGIGADNQPVIQSILLIGFGKFGAEPTIEKMEAETGQALEGKLVTLEGTLIYYDGKTLLELTKNEKALKSVQEIESLLSDVQSFGAVSLLGEIADPKCFFGVMKPGEGKPHRSCAVRCISGGIPPVLKATNQKGDQSYFIITGPNGEKVNDQILDKIGQAVTLDGQLERIDDWLYLRVNPSEDIQLTHKELLGEMTRCTDSQLSLSK